MRPTDRRLTGCFVERQCRPPTTYLILALALIHRPSTWTLWATLQCHPCLSRTDTSAFSQVSLIFCRSLLTVLLQFVRGRPGPLLYPGTSQYNACCGMCWWCCVLVVVCAWCPSQLSRLSVCCPWFLPRTIVFFTYYTIYYRLRIAYYQNILCVLRRRLKQAELLTSIIMWARRVLGDILQI